MIEEEDMLTYYCAKCKNLDYALRLKDEELQEKFMKFMDDARKHPLIGVDSNNRNSLFIHLRKIDFDLSRITQQCYTDETALICVACMHCGMPPEWFFRAGRCLDETNLITGLLITNQFNMVTECRSGDISIYGKYVE